VSSRPNFKFKRTTKITDLNGSKAIHARKTKGKTNTPYGNAHSSINRTSSGSAQNQDSTVEADSGDDTEAFVDTQVRIAL
jgi:hypothetical protein